MAQMHFDKYIPLYTDVLEELQEYCLQYFRLVLGFYLGFSFYNYQSFLDWSLSISAMHFVFVKIIAKILSNILPPSLDMLLFKNILPELLSLWIISVFTQQSLFLFIFSRFLYLGFHLYATHFSRLLLESIGIAYYLKSVWFLLPVSFYFVITSLYILEMNVLYYFFELSLVSVVLGEMGIDIKRLNREYQDQYDSDNPYYSLILHDKDFFNDLKKAVIHPHSSKQLNNQMRFFKKDIIDLYIKHPASVVHENKVIILPLEWHDFKLLLQNHPTLSSNMYLAYYQHPYHTLYRLSQGYNPWLATDRDSLKYHRTFQKLHYKEMLVLLWLKAKKNHQELQFCRDMARIYRRRNYIRDKFNFFGQDIHHMTADMPGPIDEFHHYVFQYIDIHRDLNLVTHHQIKKYWHEEIKNYWKKYLDSLTVEEFFELRYLWKDVLSKNNPLSLHYFKVMDLDNDFKDFFILKMQIQFGKKWKNFHTTYVNQLYKLSHTDHSHIEKYAIAFSSLMKKHYYEEIPGKKNPKI